VAEVQARLVRFESAHFRLTLGQPPSQHEAHGHGCIGGRRQDVRTGCLYQKLQDDWLADERPVASSPVGAGVGGQWGLSRSTFAVDGPGRAGRGRCCKKDGDGLRCMNKINVPGEVRGLTFVGC
jgi:hypothetical protein